MKRKTGKEKRAPCKSKRPKSREETPKEGSDSARRYRTATICDRAAQNARAFESFPVQNRKESKGATKKLHFYRLYNNFKRLRGPRQRHRPRFRAPVTVLSDS